MQVVHIGKRVKPCMPTVEELLAVIERYKGMMVGNSLRSPRGSLIQLKIQQAEEALHAIGVLADRELHAG